MNNKILRLKKKYTEDVSKELAKELGIKNPMALPKLKKVVVNTGLAEIAKNKELMEATKRDLATITGQIPSVRRARVSIAAFGLRKGMPVGLKVTLRGERMYDFLDKLISVVLPRLRDFRGVPKDSFDAYGNYSLGLEEQTVFPEVDLGKVVKPFGMEITIVMKSKNKQESLRLLELLGMPFTKEESENGKRKN
jgi:large subunit ribosomal protein L5